MIAGVAPAEGVDKDNDQSAEISLRRSNKVAEALAALCQRS
jgi:hypothetical protein